MMKKINYKDFCSYGSKPYDKLASDIHTALSQEMYSQWRDTLTPISEHMIIIWIAIRELSLKEYRDYKR